MQPLRLAILTLVLVSGACRSPSDEQESRPLPPPERPARGGEAPVRERAQRPSEARDATPTSATPAEAPGPGGDARGPSSEASRASCMDRCQKALALCVTATDEGDALETCKAAFESCKSGC